MPLLLLAASLIGCRHEPSVVGSWTGTLSGFDVKADLGDDKSLKINLKVGNMGGDITGTYNVDPKNLTLKPQTYKLKGVPDALKSTATQVMDGVMKQPFVTTYHFNNEDELAISYNGKTDLWKRIKDAQ